MRIRITAADPERRAMWFNRHIGKEFEVIEISDGKYLVDLTQVEEMGRLLAGKGGVPFAFAEQVDAPEESEDHLTSPLEYPPMRAFEMLGVETDALRAPAWPKEGNSPVRLRAEEIARLFEDDVQGRFYGHARDHVLRLIWTVRRLLEENEELKKRLGEREE